MAKNLWLRTDSESTQILKYDVVLMGLHDSNVNIDLNEISQENINDEILIAIVRENPVLYVKTLKDYKNKELKIKLWKSIGETLSCTG